MNTKNNQYAIVIIDDHPLFRKGVIDLLSNESDFKILGEAASGEEGIRLVEAIKPDLVLIDLNMKGMNGLQVLQSLNEMDIETKKIILSVSDTEEYFLSALRSGADGYLLKDAEPESIVLKLRNAINGEIVIDDKLTNLLTTPIRENRVQVKAGYHVLSAREVEIIKLIAKGMSNKLIARELKITEGTVKVHVKNMLRKLNLGSRLEAALWSIEHMGKRH